MTGDPITILIADRNPHVREFLRREFLEEGYGVLVAKNGREVLKIVYKPGPLHVLVLDLDLPDMDGTEILDILQDRIPSLPVVLHSFAPESGRHRAILKANAFVEKRGSSVDRLKTVVRDLISGRDGSPSTPASPGPAPAHTPKARPM